jgi:CHAD domain-containing protein
VHKAYRQAGKRMRVARRTPPGQDRDVALHQARKSARRARYAAEAATPAVGKQATKFGKQMKKVQSVVGDHQDAVIARAASRDLGIGAHLAGENAFTYGLLYDSEYHRAHVLERKARKVWKKVSRPRYRRWMKK